MKRPSDGITEAKLTPYENLFHAILLQAVNDIKYAIWKETTHIYTGCLTHEGLQAVDYIVEVLEQHAYSKDAIAKIFREITPHNYKYDLIKERLEKRGIEL